MKYDLRETTQRDKQKTQELAKYKKGEVRAQRILIESIKDHLISFIADFSTSKAIYDKLVKLYSISTPIQKISLRNQLYRTRMSNDEYMSTYLMKISQLRDQLQRLGEVIFDSQITTCVLNALPSEWRSFATSLYSRKDTTPFDEIWVQCILEETRNKAKDDTKSNEKSQAFVVKSNKKKETFGKSKGKLDISKLQCFGCNAYGHFKRDFPNKKNNKRQERSGAHITEEKEEPRENPKGEDPKDLYY